MVRHLSFLFAASVLFLTTSFPTTAVAQQSALLVPVRGPGAQADALQAATTSLRRRLETRGYTVTVLEQGVPPASAPAADLATLAQEAGADLVVDGSLQDFAGMTSLEIRIISADGSLLGEDADLARPTTLPQNAAVILANALESVPRPSGGGARPSPRPDSDVESPFTSPTPTPPRTTDPDRGEQGPPEVRPQPRPPRPRPREARPTFPDRYFWLGALIEPAMGTNRSAFNLLVGARAEFQWRGLTVGVNVDYSFIKDWEPRSNPDYHTVSLFGMIGYKIRLGSDRLSLPILAGGGYIPGNGGLLRFEAGLAIRAIDQLEIRIIFVCPNFWFLEDEMVLFASISLGLLFGI